MTDAIATAFERGGRRCVVVTEDGERTNFLEGFACDSCGRGFTDFVGRSRLQVNPAGDLALLTVPIAGETASDQAVEEDELRAVKSPREIALIRRASQIAGLGLMEAIRSTKPGLYEYHLDAAARYVFLLNGARLEGYRSITAAGTKNIWNAHYYRNLSRLNDGDLILMDYSPDYHYYVSDIGRMWPVNGDFKPWQRELLEFVLTYRNEIMKRIRPGVTARQIMDEARAAMEPVFERTQFSKPTFEKAARTLVETGGGVFSHLVGMAVHDVGRYRNEPLKPGLVFSVDPQLWVREENLYFRYEDTVVVTEDGVENFTDFLPSNLEDILSLRNEEGVVQKSPPAP